MTAPANAPGCWGAASVFDADGAICKACPQFDSCAGQVGVTLDAIKGRINVTDLLRKLGKAAPRPLVPAVALAAPIQAARPTPAAQSPLVTPRTAPQERVTIEPTSAIEAILAGMPVKPREQAERFVRDGRIDEIRKALQAGRDPFATAKPKFMSVACIAVLAGGCSKSDLKREFQAQLGWTDGTAGSHVGIATSILLAFDLVRDNAGRLEVTP